MYGQFGRVLLKMLILGRTSLLATTVFLTSSSMQVQSYIFCACAERSPTVATVEVGCQATAFSVQHQHLALGECGAALNKY